jgi:hypothetical protein
VNSVDIAASARNRALTYWTAVEDAL